MPDPYYGGPDGFDRVLDLVEADQLWIEDRNFCTLGLLFGMHRRGATFVVRQHGQLLDEQTFARPRQPGQKRHLPPGHNLAEQPVNIRFGRQDNFIHSKLRNRMVVDRAEKLVYIYYKKNKNF